MSGIKYEIAEYKDKYWFFKRLFNELAEAIKTQDADAIEKLIKKYDEIKAAEDAEKERWINYRRSL